MSYEEYIRQYFVGLLEGGGTIYINAKTSKVFWNVRAVSEVERIIRLFDVYPLLTTHKQCQ